jgi:hypothetical protein
MQACGGCSASDISLAMQVLMSPATWLVVGTALVTMIPKRKNKDKK